MLRKISVSFLVTTLAFILVGCFASVSHVQIKDQRPKLIFKNVPENSILYLDEENVGDPSIFDGKPKVLVVSPGIHNIVITSEGRAIYKSEVFVQDETKVIYI